MHKVFISHHHANDQFYKDQLLAWNQFYPMFIDMSVDTGDISEDLDDETIRVTIRDDYLRDSTVTIALIGTETRYRPHVDWELYSSMRDGVKNKKSGILVINLPTTEGGCFTAAHDNEKRIVYPNQQSWVAIDTHEEYAGRYPFMPDRIIDNLLKPEAKISVVNWSRLEADLNNLNFLINATFDAKLTCQYDMSRRMMGR